MKNEPASLKEFEDLRKIIYDQMRMHYDLADDLNYDAKWAAEKIIKVGYTRHSERTTDGK